MSDKNADPDGIAELPGELKQNMTRYRAPPGLERRIRHMIDVDSRETGGRARVRNAWPAWLSVGASFACGVLVAAGVLTLRDGANDAQRIEDEVVASHVRSLMANHLTDVASTDRHTVKPWFTGKLDYAPPVVDLASQGFPLVGGRLDYVEDRAVAALVYRRRGHTINVFVLPARDARSAGAPLPALHGFQVAQWEAGGMRFWAVSDIGQEDMAQFVAAMKAGA